MALLGRQVFLQIGTLGSAGVSIRGLRVRFNVEHSKARTPSKATVSIWNMTRDTFGLLQAPGAVLRLFAGYDLPQMVFTGTAIKDGLDRKSEGNTSIVTAQLQDGGTTHKTARVEISYSTPTTLAQVYRAAATAAGLPTGSINIASDIQFPHGFTYAGPWSDLMDRLALMSGAEWWIRDGAVQIVTEGTPTGEGTIVLSTAAKNLIGEPTQRSDGLIEVKTLLSPSLRPGNLFVVQSKYINGTYIAGDVVDEGDSGWDRDYYTTVVGKAA